MLNLFQDVDISVICEEVVESVFAGHVFQNITAQSFDMVPDARGKMSDPRNLIAAPDQLMGPGQAPPSGVAVILDVDLQNYHFTTQPGALRRLIMNLLGNALKYTSHGYVRIKLDSTDMEDLPGTSGSQGSIDAVPRSLVTLTVTDTGKGISADFLRSKLFMPFAQENSLSSGTGLGLSIVRKIVSLLEGEITIDSEVGRGTRKLCSSHSDFVTNPKTTEVRVTLPLLREMPRTTDSSSSTTKSVMSVPRETDEAIIELRSRVRGQRVVLHGFDINTKDPIVREMSEILKASIATFLVNWYGLRIVPLGQKANIIISNEGSRTAISTLVEKYISLHKSTPSIIVLCSHSSRFDHSLSSASQCNVGFVAKPVGPLKLAKAITQCLEGESGTVTPGPDGPTSQPESSDLSNVFEELSLSPRGGEVLDNTRMAADSANARKAIESPTPSAIVEKHAEFPFPPALDTKPSMPKSISMPADKATLSPVAENAAQPASLTLAAMENASLASNPKTSKKKIPTMLLVDDNQINLRLLSTYLKRRNYEVIDEASDGLEAVKRFESRGEQGYDVVFMDITMPVLDGFGATRQIRAIEEARQNKAAADPAQPHVADGGRNPALVIAFTGRSSIEDQSEALRVGIDLFMTKPVAFKEVGKIIDNWVANREREGRGGEGSGGSGGSGSGSG
jgi:CheY-like chemotaxis protein